MTDASPITEDDLKLIAAMRETGLRWKELATRAFDLFETGKPDGKQQRWHFEELLPKSHRAGREFYAPVSWTVMEQVLQEADKDRPIYQSLILEPDTEWHPQHVGPAATVNVSMRLRNLPEGLREGDELRGAIESAGFHFGNTLSGRLTRIFDSRPISAFSAPNLNDQAGQIAAWAQERLEALLQVGDPGDT